MESLLVIRVVNSCVLQMTSVRAIQSFADVSRCFLREMITVHGFLLLFFVPSPLRSTASERLPCDRIAASSLLSASFHSQQKPNWCENGSSEPAEQLPATERRAAL